MSPSFVGTHRASAGVAGRVNAMKWFRTIFETGHRDLDGEFQTLQERFANFLALLEKNNQVL